MQLDVAQFDEFLLVFDGFALGVVVLLALRFEDQFV
jgi:hypothetical protein